MLFKGHGMRKAEGLSSSSLTGDEMDSAKGVFILLISWGHSPGPDPVQYVKDRVD